MVVVDGRQGRWEEYKWGEEVMDAMALKLGLDKWEEFQ